MKRKYLAGRNPLNGDGMRVEYEGQHINAMEHGVAHHREEGFICSGFVDLQVNGHAGDDLNAPGLEVGTVLALVKAMHLRGVTTFVPALITGPSERIKENPGALVGGRGMLDVGASADIVRFHRPPGGKELDIDAVLFRGKPVGVSG